MLTGADKTRTSNRSKRASAPRHIVRAIVVHGAEAGRAIALDRDAPIDLGRAGGGGPAPALALADEAVSKRHATIEWSAGDRSWRLIDRDSHNGTFVDGHRRRETMIAHGSVIRAGETLIVIEDVEVPGFVPLEYEPSELPGWSTALARVRTEIGMVAREGMPVLICGETGVGKELVAAELHRRSGRTGSYVPVNCAAIAEGVAESELFGHVAGAFSHAIKKTTGLFVEADGGTIFLDEVGETGLELQAKLLRVLADGEVRPVGASQSTRTTARVVAATNRDLESECAAGRFRKDLLARLSGWRIEIPALRERRADIIPLATRFLAERGAGSHFSADAAECLLLHDWRGNVRDLLHEVRAAAIRAGASEITDEHISPSLLGAPQAGGSVSARAPAREAIEAALKAAGGKVSQAARDLGLAHVTQLRRWLKQYGIDPDDYR